nr:hypothetical protein ISGA_2631 [Gordonia sp. NB41Y]
MIVAVVLALVVVGVTPSALASAGPALPPLPEPLRTWLTPPEPPQKALAKSFEPFQKSLAKTYPGTVGIAIVPVGSDSAITLGKVSTGRAWSTLKVPVSLAAERRLGSAVVSREVKAITFSDNDAAEDLWAALGTTRQSVDAVAAVLREGHDVRTHVSSELDTPSSFPGYSMWSLADQARFGAHLPCMPGSTRVLDLMGSVGPNQRWGVADLARTSRTVTGSAVKGGWGPGTGLSSAFFVRQIGVITTGRGQFAVSLAAVPKSNSFSDGAAMLTRVGDWLGRNITKVPVGRCSL